jgi:thiol-disulfide isomerase/thioredoxin
MIDMGWKTSACRVACLAAAVTLSPVQVSFAKPPAVEIAEGELPPPISLDDSLGAKVELEALQGRIVIVTFWATWCGPCMNELPILATIQKKVGPDRLQVVAVNWKEYSSKPARLKYRALFDGLEKAGVRLVFDQYDKVSNSYGIDAVPHMFILGKDGRVVHNHEGYSQQNLPAIVNELNALLSQRQG